MAFENLIDIALSYDGDLLVSDTGDMKLTSGDDWFFREIVKIIRTNNPEWELHPDAGADTENYVGRPNTRETAKELEQSLRGAITRQFADWNLEVRAVPVSRSKIEVYMTVIDSSRSNPNVLSFQFDFSGQGVLMSDDPLMTVRPEPNTIDTVHKKSTNKYLNRRTFV